MKATVSSSGEMAPDSTSFLRQATVTPPAVSEKMPSVSASSLMPSTISSSVAISAPPPVSCIVFSA